MEKFKLGKDFLILSILTLLTVLIWVGFEIHQALTRNETPRILKEQTTPLNPKLSQVTVVQELDGRISFTQEELNKASEASPSSKKEEEEEIESQPATESGQIATESGAVDEE